MESHNDPNLYARILSIVQSSGMGKSRLIDEFSKAYFVIPLNLRHDESGRLSIRLISEFTRLITKPDRFSRIRFPGPRLV